MSSLVKVHKDAEKAILKMTPRSGVAGYRILRTIIEKIAGMLSFKFSVDGGEVSEIEGGIHLKVTPGETVDPVWKVTQGDGEVTVGGGVVQGRPLSGITFNPGVGTVYVYIAISEVLSNNHGFINSFAFNGASLQTSGFVPFDDMSSGNYSIPILKFVAGALSERYESTSIGVDVIDDGTSSGLGRMRYYPA